MMLVCMSCRYYTYMYVYMYIYILITKSWCRFAGGSGIRSGGVVGARSLLSDWSLHHLADTFRQRDLAGGQNIHVFDALARHALCWPWASMHDTHLRDTSTHVCYNECTALATLAMRIHVCCNTCLALLIWQIAGGWSIYMRVYIYIYIYIYIHTHTHTHSSACMKHICTGIHAQTHTNTHVCTHAFRLGVPNTLD
jgi:hypothetical protein